MRLPWALKLLGIALVHAASVGLVARGASGLSWATMALAALCGHALLDAVTLLVHFTLDNYFRPSTPLIGEVVYYFREHHERPLAMFERGFVDNNFENSLIGLGFELLALPLSSPFVDVMVGVGAFGSAYITLIHKWSHLDDPGPLVRLLQGLRLVVGRGHHEVHHEGEGRNYGLAAGWFDGLAEAVGLFEAIERGVFWLTGAVPVHARLSPGERAKGQGR